MRPGKIQAIGTPSNIVAEWAAEHGYQLEPPRTREAAIAYAYTEGVPLVVERLADAGPTLARVLDLVAGPKRGEGLDLVAIEEGIDLTGAAGRAAVAVLESLDAWDRAARSERARRAGGKRGAPRLGQRPAERPPAEPVADAEEAATVERIRELRAAGASLAEIAGTLTAEGRPTKRGGRWHRTTVANVLR